MKPLIKKSELSMSAGSTKDLIKNNLIRVLFDILKWGVKKFLPWLVLRVWP